MRYFKRRWDETPSGAEDHWGCSWWYFEIAPDGYPVRQVELYDHGPRLRYGPDDPEDEFGALSSSRFDDADLSEQVEISRGEFEAVWSSGPWTRGCPNS